MAAFKFYLQLGKLKGRVGGGDNNHGGFGQKFAVEKSVRW
jgi:hypothetical protein